MATLGTTNISLGSAEAAYGASSTATVTMNDTNMRYLAGIPQSASGSAISMSALAGAAYIVTSGANSPINVRTAAVAAGWNGTGPVWFIINANTYSSSTGTPAITISGSFPGGLILDIQSGVTVSGRGGNGGTGVAGSAGNPGGVGGVAIAISSYTGGTLYIRNAGTITGGGGGGGAGGGGGYLAYYSGYTPIYANYAGGTGGGGAAFGTGASTATLTVGGAGGAGGGNGASSGGKGGNSATAGTAGTGGSKYLYTSGYTAVYQYNAGGAGGSAGAAVTGSTGVVTWIATGTRSGTVS
jgi:hypothetical protein